MDDVKQRAPRAEIVSESLAKVFADPEAVKAELSERYAIYSETIRVQWGLVAAGAYYNCGVIDLLRKDYKSACLNFKQALELDPNDKKARQNLDYVERKVATPVLTFHQSLDIYKKINANSGGQPLGTKACAH